MAADAAAPRLKTTDAATAMQHVGLDPATKTKETMTRMLLDILARRREAGGHGIDDDDDDRELGLFQVVEYERGRGGFGD